MLLNPYLSFNGQCEEAFKFYKSVFGGQITAMLGHRGTPAENFVPENWKDKIMHARLEVNGKTLMGGDGRPDHPTKPQGFAVTIFLDTPEDAERVFRALSEGGEVQMPIEQTFFAQRFGMCTDRYGIPWMVGAGEAS